MMYRLFKFCCDKYEGVERFKSHEEAWARKEEYLSGNPEQAGHEPQGGLLHSRSVVEVISESSDTEVLAQLGVK